MIRLGWVIALSCLLKVTASLLRRGQRNRDGEGDTPEAELKSVAEKTTSNSTQSNYDVFVSFRGKDIRDHFFSHLVKDFSQKQIHAFVDKNLKTGDEIEPSLHKAIEGSSISLVIFSENYASSHWCLDELVKIIECKERHGQIVLPVFYRVDPTDVRHQKKSYENAFVELEKKYNSFKVLKWRHVLNTSANLSGITSSSFRDDVELLAEIITRVLEKLSKHHSCVKSKRSVGIDKPIARLNSLLKKESEQVRVIGIWGMGGIGKTTIAKEIFNQNRSEYDGCCFLEKVSEMLKTHGGIGSLKEKLLSELLKESVKELSSDITRRIGRMKVLIVLDDVKDTDQLEMLFGTLDWFRSDSRIIVTTRDKQVLVTNGVDNDDLFEVEKLDSSDALALFNLNAFKQRHLEMEYNELSKRVVEYAKGIPLVLKVLAHLLRGKVKEVWESQLDELKKFPSKKVYDVMRLSYDDLDRLEQKYFLDIACFFNRLNLKVDYMKHLLKDCDSDNSVAAGLERLKDKALITISEDNVIFMHDILQEMGREVVRQESIEDPGKRSQLWDPDEICDVLKNDKGTDAIRSIRVDLSAIRKLKLSPRVFDKMTNLHFLDFYCRFGYNLDLFPQGLESFPTNLRYLSWMYYPLKSLPEKFSAENLVIFILSFSPVEKLWCGVQNLVNLKEVTLLLLSSLKELPDFSKASNLKVLNIFACNRLTSVHPSIFFLDKLVHLKITLCNSLTTFTGNSNLSSHHYLKLGCCRQLSQSKLETLVLSAEIESIPSSIKDLTRLRKLDIRRCPKLVALPELPSSLETLLVECRSLKTVLFPSTVAEQFKENKKRIEFWNCFKLDEGSLINIGLNVQINLVKLACHNLSTPEHDDYVKSFDDYKVMLIGYNNDYNFGYDQGGVYVYPGSSVPDWLEYKTTKDDMIVDLSPPHLSPLLGFVFCFILAEADCDIIEMSITTPDVEADGEKDGVDLYIDVKSFGTESDCVCMIYNQPLSRYLTRIARNRTRGFNINVTATSAIPNFDEKEEQRQEVKLKGFGISPIYHSTYQKLIQQMEEEQRK